MRPTVMPISGDSYSIPTTPNHFWKKQIPKMAGSIQMQDQEDFLFAMQLATGSMLPMAMQVAVELDVFEIIAKAGPGAQLSATDIASQLSTQNPSAPAMLDRVLRLLAGHSVLTATAAERPGGAVERVYGLASVCKFFVPDEDGVSLSPLLLIAQDKAFTDSWHCVKDAILEGGVAFDMTHGMPLFDYTESEPRFNQIFNRSMFNQTTIVMKNLLKTYKGFEYLREVVDVGGGVGTTISIITSKYPTIKGINFDLPHVIQHALPIPGVEHVGGDMFESVPKSEAIFMKWILHNWDDEHCLKLLKNCYKALPDNGKVIVVEGILPDAVESDNAAKGLYQMDLIMAQINPGKERSEKEFDSLAKNAGYVCSKKLCYVYNFWVIEFCKQ